MPMLWLIIVQILEIDSIVGLLDRLIAVLPLIFVAVALVLVAASGPIGIRTCYRKSVRGDNQSVAGGINPRDSGCRRPLVVAHL